MTASTTALVLLSAAGDRTPVTGHDLAGVLRAAAGLLRGWTGPVTLLSGSAELPLAALADLSRPRPGPAAAVVTTPGSMVRVLHHRVVAVSTDGDPLPGAGADLIGLLRLNPEQIPAAADAIEQIASETGSAPPADAGYWATLAVVRAGIPVSVDDAAGWPLTTEPDTDVPAAEAARIRLDRANRADDGVYSLLVLRRLSKPLTALGAARGWSPNVITVFSLLVGLVAAGLFATGQRWALVLGAVLLQASLVIDCSDGEVARMTGQYSTVGAWLDAATDRVKEYAAYAGLAFGAATSGDWIWALAALTMILQTVRHFSDYTFNRIQVRHETRTAIAALSRPGADDARFGSMLPEGSVLTRTWAEPIKKMIHLPIGERWLLISLTAAFLTPAWTFGALLVLGVLALGYTTVGRLLRSRTWPTTVQSADLVEPQLNLGPLLDRSTAARRWADWVSDNRFAWALPSLTTAVELLAWLVVALIWIPTWSPLAFAVIFTIAFHRYDILYRALAGQRLPTGLRNLAGGVDGRLLYLAAITVAGIATTAVLASGYLLAAVWLGMVAVVIASAQWIRVNQQP